MYGTLTTFDTLASNFQTVAEYGEDRAYEAISRLLDAHNRILREDLAEFVEFSIDRQRRYGGADTMEMVDVDEMGTADAQKVSAGQTVGFPLRLRQSALQWTRKWFQVHTVSELAVQYEAARTADIRRIRKDLLNALFQPTNYTFNDSLIDHVDLPVKRLLNADGVAIPPDAYGNTVDGSTHTHYLGTASFSAADLQALIDTVVEHNPDGAEVKVFINRAEEAAVRAFAGFTAYLDARIVPADTTTRADGALNMTNVQNRAIGVFDAAEIWVKSWIPANYALAFDMNPSRRPLVYRVRPGVNQGFGDLQLASNDEAYPLRAQHFEREFGIGVWMRDAAAVLRTNNATYAAPTIS